MLKARLNTGALILGITAENVERILKGNPIRVRHDEVGDTTGDIVIMYGETLDDLIRLITPHATRDTELKISED